MDRTIAPDHDVRLIARMVDEALDLGPLRRCYSGRGSLPHRPDLLLKLALYEHSDGRPRPVQWHDHTIDSKAVQWLTYGLRPSLTSLYNSRDRSAAYLKGLNEQVIRRAIDAGYTDASCGALDGTTVAANATRHRMVNLKTVARRLEALDALIIATESAAGPEPGIATEPEPGIATEPEPEPAAGRSRWQPAATPRGRGRQRRTLLRARRALEEKLAANDRRRSDKKKGPDRIKVAPGDPEAAFGLDKKKTYRPLYNVQIVSDVRTTLILAYETTATATDSGLLPMMVERTTTMTGRPLQEVLVDAGYPSGEDLAACEAMGVVVYGPWNENSFTEEKRTAGGEPARIPKGRFTYDAATESYRCPADKVMSYDGRATKYKADGTPFEVAIYRADPRDCAACPLAARCMQKGARARTVRRQEHEGLIEALQARMELPGSKEKYRQRCCTVELRFADLKTHRGLEEMSGRTPRRADAQVGFTVLGHNLRALAKLQARAQTRQPAAEIAA